MVKRTRWKPLVAIAAVLTVGILVSCLLIGKMRERKEFVSEVTGEYWYRCTLSTDWRPPEHAVTGSGEEHSFSAAPSPIREWIAIHLLRRPTPIGNPGTQKPHLTLGRETGKGSGFIHVRSGYPELDLGTSVKVIAGKHFRIDNCPATLSGIDLTASGSTDHYTIMLICTPDYANTYFVTSTGPPAYSEQVDREMQAIIASFHVEKVAVSPDGKR